MHKIALMLTALLLVAAAPARADDDKRIGDRVLDALANAALEAKIQTERAIMLGGILIYRNRHAVSGSMLGCAAGAAAGAASALALSTVSGGAAALATPEAAMLGCGLGGAAGAALGQKFDAVPALD